MPSTPILQACWNTTAPSGCSRCSFRRRPGRLLRRMLASVALRTSFGSRRRSAPFSSSRSKAYRNAYGSFRLWRRSWNEVTPIASQHTLAVDQAGPHLEIVHGHDHERVALRPVIAPAGDQTDAHRVATGHQPEAIVLDLVYLHLRLSDPCPTRHPK